MKLEPKTAPPKWLIIVTAVFTLMLLVMAVAETTLWIHYLIDEKGEFICLFGLAFILAAGLYLYGQKRLWVSLPLALPWIIYPVITQGDQIIDHLSINPMRLVVHILLAFIFGAPLAIIVMAAHHFLKPTGSGTAGAVYDRARAHRARLKLLRLIPGLVQLREGRLREGICYLTLTLLLLEVWVANAYLGTLMIVTLITMGFAFLLCISAAGADFGSAFTAARAERLALKILVAGVVISLALYLGFKNRPGAYQGSPSAFLDPAQKDALYQLARVQIPPAGTVDGVTQELQPVLNTYGEALKELYGGYHILDRSYTYAFHNALFLRSTPVLPDFREKALSAIANSRRKAAAASQELARLQQSSPLHGPLAALVEEVRSYVDYNLDRARVLETMSADFELTEAGLQHAAHLYEGENKMLGSVLMKIIEKHRATLDAPHVKAIAATFVGDSEEVYRADANRVVGF